MPVFPIEDGQWIDENGDILDEEEADNIEYINPFGFEAPLEWEEQPEAVLIPVEDVQSI